MPKYTPEEQAAKRLVAANRFKVRQMLLVEKYDEAVAFAKENNFDVFEARLPAIYKNEAEPFFQKLEQRLGVEPKPPPPFAGQARLDEKAARLAAEAAEAAAEAPLPVVFFEVPPPAPVATVKVEPVPEPKPEPPPPDEPVNLIRGWPEKARTVVWKFCPNKLLVIIKLPDGRTASMWKGGRHWLIHDKVNVRLPVDFAGDPIYERDLPRP
jgi:hypothetical protein